jgi:hypothetical protein
MGDPLYAQNCTAGFYCEAGSATPVGNGLCPKGFYCPAGTALPIPTPIGSFAEIDGVQRPAVCPPGYYAPTIETVECYPCPPGSNCENDGMGEAVVCPPGSFRSIDPVDGVVCRGCPQGRWSKQWELRDESQCTVCPPGVVCPRDGTTFPCSLSDLPTPYVPLPPDEITLENVTFYECRDLGEGYAFGILDDPIDSLGRGPNLVLVEPEDADFDLGACYTNRQDKGSVVFQRFKDYHGATYEIQVGDKHQGYGDTNYYNGYFGFGSLYIALPVAPVFEPGRNCSEGVMLHNDTSGADSYYYGNCEAEQICAFKAKPQAEPCEEGYVCGENTTALTALAVPCAGGFVCGFGTTPDNDLRAPAGQYNDLCPIGHYCLSGTAESRKLNAQCPAGYFCPTGSFDPLVGFIANDGFFRDIDPDSLDPFYNETKLVHLPYEDLPRHIGPHDQRCFDGINEELIKTTRVDYDLKNRPYDLPLALEANLECGRDHKWRTIADTLNRDECDCQSQTRLIHEVYRLYMCSEKDPVWGTCRFTYISEGPAAGIIVNDTFGLHYPDIATTTTTNSRARGKMLTYSQPIPPSSIASRYWRQCDDVQYPCDPRYLSKEQRLRDNGNCLYFCSYAELKEWVERRWLEEIERTEIGKLSGSQHHRIEPFIYDLKYAIDLTDDVRRLDRPDLGDDDTFYLGNDTANVITLDPVSGEPLRLDTCRCESSLRCPNGTTSYSGSHSVYDCEII